MRTKEFVRKPIGQMPLGEKPRERMLSKGAESLSNAELIAILIGSGTIQASAIDLGNQLVLSYESLNHLARADIAELSRIPGLGPASVTKLAAAFELGRRRMGLKDKSIRLGNPETIAEYIRPSIMDSKKEVFMVLYFNSNLNLLGHKKVAEGGINSVALDPKVIFREAALMDATGIVISHNHPSGNEHPSRFDETVTERILHAGMVMEIKLLDHIIVTQNDYFSFRDSGKLDEARDRIERLRRAAKL